MQWQASVLESYGSAAQPKPEDVALLGQTEGYVEYNAQGRVIKGQALPVSLHLCHQDVACAPGQVQQQ